MELKTERLLLNSFKDSDAELVAKLAGDKRVVKFGFEEKSLNKIWAEHKTINIASGRVMEKAGLKHEGIMRNHYKQDENDYLDMSIKSILKSEYKG